MAAIVVVGAGLGGLAAAARLAKLGHRVTVCERNPVAGGAIRAVDRDGFRWDAGPSSTTLPAVLRDLFRASGRPIERYVGLRLRTPARRHVFEDGSVIDLPTGSRGQQIEAVDLGLGPGTGRQWADYVDGQAHVWATLRMQVLDDPEGGRRLADRELGRALSARVTLARLFKRSFTDERLRVMAAHPFVVGGSDPKDVPAYAAVDAYVERSFGVWTIPGGMSSLTDALVTRLDERGVELLLDTEVAAINTDAGRVTGVQSVAGKVIAADVVVTDIDPRVVFGGLLHQPAIATARSIFLQARPAVPVGVTHLGLDLRERDVPVLPDEVVLHGEPLLVVQTGGDAPAGHRAWTVWWRGSRPEDLLMHLVRRGIDVRRNVVTRVDRTPAELVNETGGSPFGLAWAGWRAQVERAAWSHPLPGLHLLGASQHPGASIPYVAWGAAHVAARIGKAG